LGKRKKKTESCGLAENGPRGLDVREGVWAILEELFYKNQREERDSDA